MGKIVKLKNANNEYTYPVTKTEAVYIEDNKTTLKDYLDAMSITQSAGPAEVVTFNDGANSMPVKELTLNIEPHQGGSGDPSPDNVRSISGYESVKLYRTGKNMLDPSLCVERTQGGVTRKVNANGTITLTGTPAQASHYWRSADDMNIPFKAGTYAVATFSNRCTLRFVFQKARDILSDIFTLDEDDVLLNARFFLSDTGTALNEVVKPILVSGETIPTDFEPYQGETYDIAIPTAAETVYGGSLEINEDGSGTLTVEYAKVTINGSSGVSLSSAANPNGKPWIYAINATNATEVSSRAVSDKAVSAPSKSNSTIDVGEFHAQLNSAGTRVNVCFLTDSTVTTLAELQAKLAENPYELAYPLATPTIYTLTAEQVTTLLGDNTLWMDADGTINLRYRADLTKYITNIISSNQGD